MLSDKIKKINMFNWVQERLFIITMENIYNIKKLKIKRKINVSTHTHTLFFLLIMCKMNIIIIECGYIDLKTKWIIKDNTA